MKALVFHGAHELRLEELPMPLPAADEALVKVKAVGICGSDIHGYAGKTGRRAPGMVMGHEFCGVVEKAAWNSSRFKAGQPVVIQPILFCGKCPICRKGLTSICPNKRFIGVDMGTVGGLAEYIAVPERNLFPLPIDLPFELGAITEAFAVGSGAARNSEIKAGDTVAIVGCGVIGLTILLMTKAYFPAKIFIIDNNPERLKIAADLGAEPVNFSKEKPEDVISSATGGLGTDISIEAVGCSPSVATAIKVVRNGGRIVWVGNSQKIIDVDMQDIVVHGKHIVGMYCYNDDDFGMAMEFISCNPEIAARFAEEKVSMADAPEMFRQLASGSKQPLRTVVII